MYNSCITFLFVFMLKNVINCVIFIYLFKIVVYKKWFYIIKRIVESGVFNGQE